METSTDTSALSAQDQLAALVQAKQQALAEHRQTSETKKTAVEETQAADAGDGSRLSQDEQRVVDQLKARDREVRDHEQAHARVGGAYASEPSYSYQTGPDGRRYAIGGEVQIDVAPVANDPEATIAKMLIVKAAALAPAEPSSADRRVAAMAEAVRGQAHADLMALRLAERRGETVDLRV